MPIQKYLETYPPRIGIYIYICIHVYIYESKYELKSDSMKVAENPTFSNIFPRARHTLMTFEL